MLQRWYFMAEKGRCAQFIFGGCGGNRNNFESEEYCLSVCSSSLRKSLAEEKELALFLSLPWSATRVSLSLFFTRSLSLFVCL